MNNIKVILFFSFLLNCILISIFTYKIYYRLNPKPVKDVAAFTYWKEKFSEYKILNLNPNNIGNTIFLGDSFVDRLNLSEMFPGKKILNRGIGQDDTKSLLIRLQENAFNAQPEKIIIFIGTNDILHKIQNSETIANLEKIYRQIISRKISLTVISLLPVWNTSELNNGDIIFLNKQISKLCNLLEIQFLDIYDKFLNSNNELNRDLSNDGLHLNIKGYLLFAKYIDPLI